MWIKTKNQKPSNEDFICFYYESFRSYHLGTYEEKSNSVRTSSGFIVSLDEITNWFKVEKLPNT